MGLSHSRDFNCILPRVIIKQSSKNINWCSEPKNWLYFIPVFCRNAIAKSKWSTKRLSSFLSYSNAPACTLFTLTWHQKAFKLSNSFFLSSFFFPWLTHNSSFPYFSFFLHTFHDTFSSPRKLFSNFLLFIHLLNQHFLPRLTLSLNISLQIIKT